MDEQEMSMREALHLALDQAMATDERVFVLGEDIADPGASHDGMVKRAKGDMFLELVKRTYRVLLTRGMKGCYVYFTDPATRAYVESRIEYRDAN